MNSYCPECNKPLRNPKRCSCGWEMQTLKKEESLKCSASGCPLDGTIDKGAGFYCFIHSGQEHSQAITTNIMDRRGLIHLARRGLSLSGFDWEHGNKKQEAIKYLQDRGREDLLPHNETAHQWASRCLNILKAECVSVKSDWRKINPATEKLKQSIFSQFTKPRIDYEPGME